MLIAGEIKKCLWQEALTLGPPKTTEQHISLIFDKSVTFVTNNKRLFDVLYFEANYWHTRSIAQPLCDSRATCTSNDWWCRLDVSRSTEGYVRHLWHITYLLIAAFPASLAKWQYCKPYVLPTLSPYHQWSTRGLTVSTYCPPHTHIATRVSVNFKLRII